MPNNAEFVKMSCDNTFESGKTYTIKCSFRNTGDTIWTKAEGYKLGPQEPQDNITWRDDRVWLNEEQIILPDETVEFIFEIKAPAAGDYVLAWKMLRENYEWFGETGIKEIVVLPADSDDEPEIEEETEEEESEDEQS